MKRNNCLFYKAGARCYRLDGHFLCYFAVDPYSCPDYEEGDAPVYHTPSAMTGEEGGKCVECEEEKQ